MLAAPWRAEGGESGGRLLHRTVDRALGLRGDCARCIRSCRKSVNIVVHAMHSVTWRPHGNIRLPSESPWQRSHSWAVVEGSPPPRSAPRRDAIVPAAAPCPVSTGCVGRSDGATAVPAGLGPAFFVGHLFPAAGSYPESLQGQKGAGGGGEFIRFNDTVERDARHSIRGILESTTGLWFPVDLGHGYSCVKKADNGLR